MGRTELYITTTKNTTIIRSDKMNPIPTKLFFYLCYLSCVTESFSKHSWEKLFRMNIFNMCLHTVSTPHKDLGIHLQPDPMIWKKLEPDMIMYIRFGMTNIKAELFALQYTSDFWEENRKTLPNKHNPNLVLKFQLGLCCFLLGYSFMNPFALASVANPNPFYSP